jgi:two-component system, NarL family, nitrate/nitrite response regulator NarL
LILVLVLGPVRVFRDGLAQGLASHRSIRVVASLGSPDEAARRVGELGAEVVLIDASGPDGVVAARVLTATGMDAKLVAIGASEEDDDVISCAEAGFHAFVSREGGLTDVVTAAERVVRGETVCSPRVAATLLRRVAAGARGGLAEAQPVGLTARELQIVELIDDGLSNKEIAGRLCIEVSTVKNHVHHVLEKLGVRRRAEAAARMRTVRVRRATREPAKV